MPSAEPFSRNSDAAAAHEPSNAIEPDLHLTAVEMRHVLSEVGLERMIDDMPDEAYYQPAPTDRVHVDENGNPFIPEATEHHNVHDVLAGRHQPDHASTPAPQNLELSQTFQSSNGAQNNITESFSGVNFSPEILRIARQMRGLGKEQFLMLAELTQRKAWGNVHSMLEYRGTAWYLPTLRPVEENEPANGIGYERSAGLVIAVRGWRLEINVLGYTARAILLVGIWLILWSAMPQSYVELRGVVFDPLLLFFFCAIVGGIISRVLRFPALMCVLWMGIMWNNMPSLGYFTSGIDPTLRTDVFTGGLTVILIRAGLNVKPEEVRPILVNFAGFALLPMLTELMAHSFMASVMFDYENITWAFAQGSIVAAVSPAVVVPALLTLKLDGYGLTRGPSMIMMPAAPTEMVAAIWIITFISSIAIPVGGQSLALTIALGPIQIVGGLLLGGCLGFVHFTMVRVFLAEARKLPHRNYTHEHMSRVGVWNAVSLVVLCGGTLYYGKSVELTGGAALAVAFAAFTTGILHRRRSDAIYFEEQFKHLCLNTADLWDLLAMPALFSMVGTELDLASIFNSYFFPRFLACLFVGLLGRVVMVSLVTIPLDFTRGERVVCPLGWCGKASVQAALGTTMLLRAQQVSGTVSPATNALNLAQARQIENAAVAAIMICAPLASMVMVRVGPLLMPREKVPSRK